MPGCPQKRQYLRFVRIQNHSDNLFEDKPTNKICCRAPRAAHEHDWITNDINKFRSHFLISMVYRLDTGRTSRSETLALSRECPPSRPTADPPSASLPLRLCLTNGLLVSRHVDMTQICNPHSEILWSPFLQTQNLIIWYTQGDGDRCSRRVCWRV